MNKLKSAFDKAVSHDSVYLSSFWFLPSVNAKSSIVLGNDDKIIKQTKVIKASHGDVFESRRASGRNIQNIRQVSITLGKTLHNTVILSVLFHKV